MNKITTIPLKIGLTGGIACGKSSIASIFAELGTEIIDADEIARYVVQPGMSALNKLKKRFGDEIIQEDGTLDRSRLRKIAFDPKNPKNLDDLNAIMQEDIRIEFEKRLANAKGLYVIAMIPLLFERKMESYFDRILVIDVEEELQIKRVMARDQVSRELALSMIGKQVSRQYRMSHADDLIESDDTPLDKKRHTVIKLHKYYQQIAEQNLAD